MKKGTRKAFISLLAATTIFTSTAPVLANKITVTMPRIIYETTNSQNISSGIKHENLRKFTESGWLNINVIRIDLTDEYTELKGLMNPNGIPSRDKVSTMVDKSGAVAAINGDYFNYKPLPSSLGTMINDGELISSPIELEWALPTLYITNGDKANIDYLDRKMVATNLNKGNQVIINTLNKVTEDFSTITLLNKNWGTSSIGNKFHQDLTEVLIVDGIVSGKRTGGEAFEIPKDGEAYVLAVRNTSLNSFEVGDSVNLELSTVPDLESIKFAIGGGSIILKNGELSLTNINSKGNEPRTGIGINKDSTELILATIDGRDTSFKGVSQEMFGAILRDLGAYNALNLDGGGSTTMAIKPKDEEKSVVVNKPSDGGERSVVNAVGVFSNAPVEELAHLKLSTDDNKMFLNTTRSIKVKGYDRNYNPIDLNDSEIRLSAVDLDGTFEGNKFKASSEGKGKIVAEYDGIVGEMELNVLGEVKDILYDTPRINVDINSEYKFNEFYGKDAKGTKAKIYLEDIVFNVLGEIGEVRDGKFYSKDVSAGGAISAYVGNSVENILVSVGSKGTLIDGFENIQNYSFSAYPETAKGSLTQSSDANEGKYSLSLNYDFTQGEGTRAAYAKFSEKGNPGLTLPDYPKKLGLWVKGDGSGTWLRANLTDAKGVEHVVDFAKTIDFTDWRYLTVDIPSQASYPVKLQRIYVAETDGLKKPTGQILFDGLSAHYPSPIGNLTLPTPTEIKDDLATKQPVAENGFSFIVVSEPKGLNKLVGYDATSTIRSRISNNKIGVLLNGASPEFTSGLNNYTFIDTSKSYSTAKHNDVIFFNINSSKGGIRATEPNQWFKLIEDLKNKQESNFILFLPTPIFGANGFSDKLEADLLHTKLVEAKENGKNIFVVQGSNTTNSEIIDGVRYIQLNTKKMEKPEDIYDISVVEFVANDNNISYEIIKLFEKPKIANNK
jgi:exopolysaccharide biosynthesis protein